MNLRNINSLSDLLAILEGVLKKCNCSKADRDVFKKLKENINEMKILFYKKGTLKLKLYKDSDYNASAHVLGYGLHDNTINIHYNSTVEGQTITSMTNDNRNDSVYSPFSAVAHELFHIIGLGHSATLATPLEFFVKESDGVNANDLPELLRNPTLYLYRKLFSEKSQGLECIKPLLVNGDYPDAEVKKKVAKIFMDIDSEYGKNIKKKE